jgi:hypothetical protein
MRKSAHVPWLKKAGSQYASRKLSVADLIEARTNIGRGGVRPGFLIGRSAPPKNQREADKRGSDHYQGDSEHIHLRESCNSPPL